MESQNPMMHPQQPQYIIIKSNKSVGIALILTFFFGPLGMLYSTISGGIIMLIITGIVALFTLGVGLLITWPICMIWAAISANNYNNKLRV